MNWIIKPVQDESPTTICIVHFCVTDCKCDGTVSLLPCLYKWPWLCPVVCDSDVCECVTGGGNSQQRF